MVNLGGKTIGDAIPIEVRHRTYFAYLDVPQDVRDRLGRRVFRQTLQTDSRSIALRRAAPIIARWKSQVAAARNEPGADDAQFWREALRRTSTPEEREAVLEQIESAAWDIGAANVANVGDKPSTDPEARQFVAEATGARVATDEHLDEWIDSLQVKTKTANMRWATINRLAEKFDYVHKVTRPEVRRWLTELLANLKPATAQRMMTDCRQYWRYLATIEVVPEDSEPFDKLGLKVKQSSWLPFEPADAIRILRAAEAKDEQLGDLVRMAMYTGARREELCALRVEHVRKDQFDIADAKTDAGIRTVPIHSRLRATMARLTKNATDGYLFGNLDVDKYGHRGDGMGKLFGRLKKALGFGDRYSFHSWRATVITMLERAGVPEGTVQDIVGHRRSTLTGSTYSGKSTVDMRKAALAKLRYPLKA